MELAYQGKAYHGWQKQINATSVQEKIEEALFTICRFPVEITGAGRTDAGVHARQIFAHFDVEETLPSDFIFRMNTLLAPDIAAKDLRKVTNDAHARFDALSRKYEYHIIQEKDPFNIDFAYWVKRPLNLELMNRAAKILLEYENFKCFSRSRTDVKTYYCKIETAFWERQENKLIFHIQADRFLRNMVRAIVGTILETGLGKMEVEKIHEIIKSENRSEAGASVPAHGLYLTQVKYPENIFLN